MEDKKKGASGGIGFSGALQIALIILQLCGVIDWPLWVLLLPLEIDILLLVVIAIIIIIINNRY